MYPNLQSCEEEELGFYPNLSDSKAGRGGKKGQERL